MDQVAYHLELAIYRWCGLQPPAYGPGDLLGSLWLKFSSAPYIPTGAAALMSSLYTDPFFQSCPRAQELTPGMFGAGGTIQTVSDLYFFLRPCGDSFTPSNSLGNVKAGKV